MAAPSKHAFGSKENIQSAMQKGIIDEYDVLYLDNGEIGWITPDNEIIYSRDRLKKDIVVQGCCDCLGISDGTVIPAGSTMDDIISMIVRKRIVPEYKKPTIDIQILDSESERYEVGQEVFLHIKADFAQNNAGSINELQILRNDEILVSSEENTVELTEENSVLISDEPIIIKAIANYNAGETLLDNLGDEVTEGKIEAGSIESEEIVIRGIRKLFYGYLDYPVFRPVSDVVRNLQNQLFTDELEGTISMTVPEGQQSVLVAIPIEYHLTNVYYKNLNDNDMLDYFEQFTIKVNGSDNNELFAKDYNCYLYVTDSPCQSNMDFEFTIE